MTIRSRIYLAGGIALALFVAAQEAFHYLGIGGAPPILAIIACFGGFYGYALSFRCARCGGRLFTMRRLATPFLPETCSKCGRAISN